MPTSPAEQPTTAASDDENTELDLDYTGWNRPTTTAAPSGDFYEAAERALDESGHVVRYCPNCWRRKP